MRISVVLLTVVLCGLSRAEVLNKKCSTRGMMCTMALVCGTDGKMYNNGCAMWEAICRSGGKIQRSPDYSACRKGRRQLKDFSDDLGCPMICPFNYAPVCGSDGKTYSNKCALNAANCVSTRKRGKAITVMSNGDCKLVGKRRIPPFEDSLGCPTMCAEIYSPVCGSNGKTYSNMCTLNAANCVSTRKGGKPITMKSAGDCEGRWIG